MAEKVNFDEITKIITVTLAPDATGEIYIDVKTDLYSDGKEDWVDHENLRKFAFPVRSVGGDDLPGSKALGATFFLASDWKIRPYEASHKLVINGNLYSEDGTDPFLDTIGTYTVRIIQQVSSLVDSTVQQLTDIEYASFGGGVTIDVINGVPGTGSAGNPIGNIQNPSNNLTDTMTIATERGFGVIFVKGDLTIDSGYDYTGMTFEGESQIKSELTVSSAANVLDCEFYNAYITGTLDGNCVLMNCRIDELNYIHGVIEQCTIDPGVIQLGGTENALFLDCWAGGRETGVSKVIDCGGGGQGLTLRNYNGGIVLRNKTGPEHISIDLNSGRVGLENTIVSGTINVRGVGELFDYDTGENIPTGVWNGVGIDNNTISNTIIAEAVYNEVGEEIQYASYNDGVSIDVINGVSGTEYNVGTIVNPVNNLVDAVQIANTRGFDKLYINKSMTLDSGTNIENFSIVGKSRTDTEINIDAGALCSGLGIERCNVSGTLDGNTRIRDCYIGNINYVNGHIFNCGLYGTITLAGNEDAILSNCYVVDLDNRPVIDMGGSGQNCVLTDYSGSVIFQNLTGDNTIAIQIDGGKVTLDSTITSGFVGLNGVGQVIDNSGDGCTVVTDGLMSKQTITEISWNTVWVDSHITSSGTVFPLGTPTTPVNNIEDAKTIAIVNNIERFHIHGNVTLESAFEAYTFTSNNPDGCIIDLNSQTITNTNFDSVSISGSGVGHFNATDCEINYDYTGIDAHLENCILLGTFTIASSATLNMDRCTCSQNTIFNLNGTGSVGAANFSGIITFMNATDPLCFIAVTGYYVATLLSSCTAGNAFIAGVGILNDYSNGITITERTLPSTMWDEQTLSHTVSGTYGNTVSKIKKETGLIPALV